MLEPRIMPASYASFFMFVLVHMLALVVSFLAIYASFRRLCSRYGDISIFLTTYLPLLLSIILRSMHVQQNACLVFVVDHTRCMVFDYGKYIQHIYHWGTRLNTMYFIVAFYL